MAKSRNLRHLLTEIIRTHQLEAKILEQKVFALWRKHLDAPLNTKTVPVSLSSGVLKIRTAHPAYVTELSFHKQRLLTDLNAELGQPVLTDLRIECRPAHAAPPPEQDRSALTEKIADAPKKAVTSEQLDRIEQTLTSVSDTELRKALAQLFTTQSKL